MPYIDNAELLAADKELRYLSRFRTERWPYMRDNCHPPTRPKPRVAEGHSTENKIDIEPFRAPLTPLKETVPQAVSQNYNYSNTPVVADKSPVHAGPLMASPQDTPVNRLNKTQSAARNLPRKRVSKYAISTDLVPVTPITPQQRLPFKDLVNRPLGHARQPSPQVPTAVAPTSQPTKKRRYKYEIID